MSTPVQPPRRAAAGAPRVGSYTPFSQSVFRTCPVTGRRIHDKAEPVTKANAVTAIVFLLVGTVWGATIIGDSGQFSALVTERGDRELVGTALTVQLGLGFALTSVTIWLVPVVARHIGWQWASLCLVPGPLVGILAMAMLARTTDRSAAALQASG